VDGRVVGGAALFGGERLGLDEAPPGTRGQTPVVERPGQRQSISATSAVNAKGALWFSTYGGALNAELFVELLQKMMYRRKKPVHLILDSLPAHKKATVRDYLSSTHGRLTLHFLPGYAPDLNPDEPVWSHVKRTGAARRPWQKGEKLRERIEAQLAKLQKLPRLVRSAVALLVVSVRGW
jgi:transposase